MNRLTKIALAGALFFAPTSAFASFDGDEGAFWEDRSPRLERSATRTRAARTDRFSRSFKHDGDESAFFERRSPRFKRSVNRTRVTRVAGFFATRVGSGYGRPGYLFNRADANNDGRLNRWERRRFKRLLAQREMQG